MRIAIIGGGAAGFFAAIAAKENYPNSTVVIFEKSTKLLAKVKISGGGRCNVTNGSETIKELAQAYPRGANQLKKAFGTFNNHDVMDWFTTRDVPLVTQDDNCVFPESQDSQSIIDCFLSEARRLDVKIKMERGVRRISEENKGLSLHFSNNDTDTFDKVIVTTGGSPKKSGLEWLENLGHKIIDPVPSLFTFNMPNEKIRELMGIVVENATVNIQGSKLKTNGPLLITHWGMSGPAILKLSAFGARELFDKNYNFKVQVNWVSIQNMDFVLDELRQIIKDHPNKLLTNYRPYKLPLRLWTFLLAKCSISEQMTWSQIGKKGLNKLANTLTNDVYEANGKTTFKEEFVTCGGVSLESVDFKTMQSKAVPNMYFAGELLNIDGITGGYNFQAAWTTAFIAAKLN